ncbi:flagellar biosynthesis protein FlhF [Desulfobulbus alkaliphilus]|uniref:flagellar biosynthesis protein FlhF n=1 Tax=Desulfobulbus alkaliphilus TaxID=869814 RepID=UPI0019664094|nr:flagellar biosynthesis protein FlhF [Desulfobulbus alkaliphilus]MBM9537416.1 flagellar biosynthesis protein FlhF [Desulfobulbus alkaliphilus]
MQVKVFEAKDMTTGLKMVKETLGPDALILSTRTVRNGRFGVIGKPMLEITAAIDTNWRESSGRAGGNPDKLRLQKKPSKLMRDITYEEIWAQKEEPPPPAEPSSQSPSYPDKAIHSELAELRNLVKSLSSRIPPPGPSLPRTPMRAGGDSSHHPRIQTSIDPVITFLVGYGISQETAQVVARFTRDTIEQTDHLSPSELTAILKAAIARLFATEQILAERPTAAKQICLVGPTGVGKTTTLAKIAADYLGRFGHRIALITIDTYRIAAVEQLKVYAEIMHLPLEVVLTPRELRQALEKFRDYELILIDTAGRSPKNSSDLQELAGFLLPHPQVETHLLLAATTREREIEETIRRFGILPINNFIFTKIDECDQLGVLLNVHYNNDTPISFLTNGQRVPEDLITPTPAAIADLIMNEHGNLYNG